ncbi:chemotaxis-specific protein-glutamate methyltransferase CheB [Altererythrobacter aquiaggeris]|uniref:chemotaxis-specific protein-glutamate methyltransferase CheB n=1 Tax=Aestuarierythrobacter aquiaggeris TaxID=1898396 RepID=UPI00301ABCFE
MSGYDTSPRAARNCGDSAGPDRPASANKAIRIMVVDDSLVARTVLCKVVEATEDFVLCATANTAEEALSKLADIRVDVILLDLEMPGIGGLAALPAILEAAQGAQVMVVSSLTSVGAEATVEALSIGAADTILKPRPGEFSSEYRSELADRIRDIGNTRGRPDRARTGAPAASVRLRNTAAKPARVIAIGASTGGIHSMCQVLGKLPKDFDLPILVTQHLPAAFSPVFARQLEIASGFTAIIAQTGSPLIAGEILIAPGAGHLVVELSGGVPVARITRDKVANNCCPSVDPMLESLAGVYDGAVLAVILSGMGRDGEIGARAIVDRGGMILAQSPETCAVWGMPRAVAEAGLASAILPPEGLGARIANCKRGAAWQ